MLSILDDEARAWQDKARRYADDCLQPHEVEAELNQGELPPDIAKRNKQAAIELGFSGMDVPRSHGGHELSILSQVAVWEQLGRTTNALSWCFAEPQSWMFEACSAEQIERYILPLMRGDKHDCYAITEGESEQALFFVDQGTPGIDIVATPHFSHTYAAHHPTYRFRDVDVPREARVGQRGDGMAFTRTWFRRERLMIAARCCGAAARLIEEASAFAKARIVGGEPLSAKQAIQAMLADSATDLWAARLMAYETAAAQDRGADVKVLHGRCSMAKLFASEMANRVADRAVQIFGGRGYMRENVAERFFRELRVDRIWEGTSEIQRLIIAGALLKRGLDGL